MHSSCTQASTRITNLLSATAPVLYLFWPLCSEQGKQASEYGNEQREEQIDQRPIHANQ